MDWKSPKHLNKLFSLYLEFNFTLILFTTLNFYYCPLDSSLIKYVSSKLPLLFAKIHNSGENQSCNLL
jgi:hypothetical protein